MRRANTDSRLEAAATGRQDACPTALEALGVGMRWCPLGQAARAEEIAVVVPKFLLACARYVGQFEFEFLGGAGNLAAFNDVLFAGARGLHHLVEGAVFFVQKARGEINGGVIDDLGFLAGEKVFVAAVRGG